MNNKLQNQIIEIRKAYYPLIFRIFSIYIIIDIIVLITWMIIIATGAVSEQEIPSFIWLAILFLIKFIIIFILTIRMTIDWTFTYYHIENDNLVKLQGFYTPKETLYSLNQIYAVEAYSGFLGRIFKYGDLTLTFSTQGDSRERVRIWGIVEPFKYRDNFRKYLK
jgi:uncharacterized membrane protein YdbT with pleckstrin-like domain